MNLTFGPGAILADMNVQASSGRIQ